MKRSIFQKLLVLAFVSGLGSTVVAQTGHQPTGGNNLFTHASIELAWQSAVAAKKPLLVMFESDHCVYCRKMLAETYSNPTIQQMLAQDTETVLAKAADYRSLVKKMGIRGYPTTILVSPQGEVLDLVEGYIDAKAFAKRVRPLLAKQAIRVSDASAASSEPATIGR